MSQPLKTLAIDAPLKLDSGATLPRLQIGYRTWGRLDAGGSNAVLVCPALTGDSNLEAWWPGLLGPGRALDPATDFIVCADVLGGSGATTGPLSRGPGGLKWRNRFPAVSVRDMIAVQKRLLDHLGVQRLRLAIGGSLGGMQALEWVASHSESVESAAVIAAPARQSAWARALNHVQRRALQGHRDLELARMVAMLSYRHWDNLDGRFDTAEGSAHSAEDWLDHHGRALKARFDAVSYQRLMAAMDGHDVGRGRGGWQAALGRTSARVLIVAITSDLLYPPRDQRMLADALPRAGLDLLDAPHGHDAFLIEQQRVERLVSSFRRQSTRTNHKFLEVCP